VSTDRYRFKLGGFECVSLSDGSLDYPLQNFFANVPKAQIEGALRQRNLPIDYITTPYTYLYINTGEHRVLVDMGAGDLAPTTGRLPQSMKGAGIDPADMDMVVITHAHPDHVGGTLDDEGKPVYPNARYYIWKDEWNFWFSEIAFTKAPVEHPDWIPIYDIIPEEAAASKRRIFDRAAEERALVVGQHFPPFPSVGYVVKEGEGWQWQPIKKYW
jgi:glyoxylase-like metal-dependent hydrolase (beta-lactamase superfamily II)